MANLAQTYLDSKLKWANGGVACDTACLDSTAGVLTALQAHETLTDPTTSAAPASVRAWLYTKALQTYND